MKKIIALFLTTATLLFSCKENDLDLSKVNSENDLTTNDDAILAVNSFLGLPIIDHTDSDNDGLSDYAEDRIVGLSKTNPNDIKALNSWDSLSLKIKDGSRRKIAVFQTSWYQNHFLTSLEVPQYNTPELIPKVAENYPKILRAFRNPNFQKFILNRPAGITSGMVFINKIRAHTRGVKFYSSSSLNFAGGSDGLIDQIYLPEWALKMTNFKNSGVKPISREMIYNFGYGQDHDYSISGSIQADGLFRMSSPDFGGDFTNYPIYDLELKTIYESPTPEASPSMNVSRLMVDINIKGIPLVGPDPAIAPYFQNDPNNYRFMNQDWLRTNINISAGTNHMITNRITFNKTRNYQLNAKVLSQTNGIFIAMWVDFNDDNIYTDDEKVIKPFLLNGGSVINKISFTMPSKAKLGSHYMRINTAYSSLPTPYGPNSKGTTFDFNNVVVKDYYKIP